MNDMSTIWRMEKLSVCIEINPREALNKGVLAKKLEWISYNHFVEI